MSQIVRTYGYRIIRVISGILGWRDTVYRLHLAERNW